MKYLMLVFVVGLVFVAYGTEQLDDNTLSIEEAPPTAGLPELFSGPLDNPLPLYREIVPSHVGRNLIFRFELPSGTYEHLYWSGNGAVLPPALAIYNYWGDEVASLKTDGTKAGDLLGGPGHQLVLPHPGLLSVVCWLGVNGWAWLVLVALFFGLRQIVLRKWKAGDLDSVRWPIVGESTLLFVVLALAGVWVSFLVPGAVRYEVGDDPAMEMLASGVITGHPSEYLVFINVFLGLLLKGLYVIVPQVPWYPALILMATVFSLAGITSLLAGEMGERTSRFWWLAVFGVVFGSHFITHLQFTSAAYLLGFWGMLIFSLRTSRVSLVAAVALIFLGSLIRLESFVLLFITTALAGWLISHRGRYEKACFFVVIIFFAGAGWAGDHFYYEAHPEWQAYRQYNKLRGDLHVNPKLNLEGKNRDVLAAAGWSENDFRMFKDHWLYEDTAAFGADRLAYLDKHLVSNRGFAGVLLLFLAAVMMAPAPILLLLTVLVHEPPGRRRFLIRVAAFVAPMLLILGYLAVTTRIPTRVVIPPVYAVSILLFVSALKEGEVTRRLRSTIGLPLIFITMLSLAARSLWMEASANAQDARQIESSLKSLTAYPGQTFVATINSVVLEKLPPLHAMTAARSLDMIQLMWSGWSPSFAEDLQRHGSTSLFQSLAHDPRFWMMMPTQQWDRADCFSTYMQEHYHLKVKMTPVILGDGQPAVFPDFTVMKAVEETSP